MNVERMLKLAEKLEKPETVAEFSMIDFRCADECGTTYCIGGTACLMFGDAESAGKRFYSEDHATRVLGLTFEQAQRLFYNENNYVSDLKDSRGHVTRLLHEITREEAAAAIRRMVTEEGGQ